AKFETNCLDAEIVQRTRDGVDDLVVERAAEQRARMTDDAERLAQRHALRCLDARFDVARGAGKRDALVQWQCRRHRTRYWIASSSTSNTSVAFGGMTPAAPFAP